MKKSERLLVSSLGALVVLFFSFQVNSIYKLENDHKDRVDAILAENIDAKDVTFGSSMINLNKSNHGMSNYLIDSEEDRATVRQEVLVVQPEIADEIKPEPSVTEPMNDALFEMANIQKGVVAELHRSGFGWTVGQKVADFKKLKTRKGINKNNTLTYANVYANTDMEFVQVGNARSMNIVFNDASTFDGIPEEAEEFVFVEHIKLVPGWKADLVNNEILIRDTHDRVVMKYNTPEAKDASGNVQTGEYSIKSSQNGFVLQLAVDMEWIRQDERSYPISINPSVEMKQ